MTRASQDAVATTKNSKRGRIGYILRGIVLVLALCVTRGSDIAYSQSINSQQITGVVSDSTGALISNASITVKNTGTGISQSVKSNASGRYTVLDIPVGIYDITATAAGFKTASIQGVHVDVGSVPSVPVTLEVGSQDTTVTVNAGSLRLDTTSSEIGPLITSKEATQIQLNGRNYIQLLALSPGVSFNDASGFDLFGSFGVDGSDQSVNGVRTDSSNFFIDGVDNKDNGGGGNNFVNISPDALEEFRAAASSYDAGYGGSAGSSVNVALKSGTTAFHGVAYEFLRNRSLEGFAFQPVGTVTPLKPPFTYNDFGWTLGGPIYIPGHFNINKNKLFFFGGMEFKKKRTSSIQSFNVPSVAEKSGNFSQSPASEWPINPVTNLPFPGGIIPVCAGTVTTGCVEANGQALVNLEPSPNSSQFYNFLAASPLNTQEYLIKINYQINDKNLITGDWVHDYYTSLQNTSSMIPYTSQLPGLISSLQWTHTFSPSMVNTLTGSFSGNIINQNCCLSPNTALGLKDLTRTGNGMNYSTLYNASPDIPSLNIEGLSGLSATAQQWNNYARVYAAKDDLSKVIGNHNIRTGAYLWRSRKNQTSVPAINGSFTFTGNDNQTGQLSTNQAIANALMGNFSSYQEGNAVEQVWARFTQLEFYGQDDWKATRHLSLNLGLRWQYMEPQYSALNNTASFLPQYYSAADAATVNASGVITNNPFPYNGLVLPGSGFPSQAKDRVAGTNDPAILALFHGLPRGLANNYWNTWEPRIGFAYDLGGNQHTVVRGGYGISYERLEGNFIFGAVSQLPFVNTSNILNGNVNDVAGGSAAAAFPTTIGNSHTLNLQPPRIKNWSFGIQRQFWADTIFELNYVGSSSPNLVWAADINQLPAGTMQAHPNVAPTSLMPFLGYQDIYQTQNGSISNYQSLQAELKKRMHGGGLLNVAYTWSKCLTDANSYNATPQDSTNLRGDYGPCSFNQPQILSISYVYPLPFWQEGSGWYKTAFGRWQISGITGIHSGLPINVSQPGSTDQSGDGLINVSERPDLIGNPIEKHGLQYLNPAAFALPAPGTFGNLQHYGVKGPLYDNWDMSLQKTFPLYGPIALDFRAEMFNFPNHLSAWTVDSTTSDSTFGVVTSTTDPRTVEFALKLHL